MSVKRRGFGSADKAKHAEASAKGGKSSSARAFRDQPGLAKKAAEARWGRLTAVPMHEHNKEMGGPDKGKAGTAPSPNDAEEASRDGQ